MADIDTYTIVGAKVTIKKDPNATLDYPFDWSEWLDAISDTINAVVWTLDPTLSLVSSSFTAVTATPFISGGTVGTTVSVACKITTVGGRTDERTIWLKIVQR
jgi:hypothetical protein